MNDVRLDLVRKRRRWRVLAFGLSAAAGVALLALAAVAMGERLDRFTRTRERNALVQRVTTAAQPLAGDAVAREGEKFAGDDALLATSLRLASDSYAPDATRLNALMLSTDLLRRKRSERRWFVKAANWRNGVLDGGSVTDVTFLSGTIENLRVHNATLAGVWWNPAVTLSNSEFVGVKFDAGAFPGTNVSN